MSNSSEPSVIDAMKAFSADITARLDEFSSRISTLEATNSKEEETSPSGGKPSEKANPDPMSWADRPEGDTIDYEETLVWPDEDSSGKKFEVSESTRTLLQQSFTRGLPNSARRQQKEKHGVPSIAATRTMQLDRVIKDRLSNRAVRRDKDLARLQNYVLDAVGPLTAVVDKLQAGEASSEDVLAANQMALRLLGNASVKISQERRKNVLGELNNKISDLAEKDEIYQDAAPNLFGDEFLKQAKDREDQMKCLDKSIRSGGNSNGSRRGSAHSGSGSSYSQRGRGSGRSRGTGRYQPYGNDKSGFSKRTGDKK